MAEQHTPIGTETANQMRPIKVHCAASKNMRNVGAVEPLAFHDKGLHPNHLLGGGELHMQSQQLIIPRALEP